ncbi:MAG: hypothetical protein ACM33U_08600 [Solirubrobacterales bacterium]
MRSEDRIFYARAVWATFRSKAGTLREMSNAEFVLIGRWMDRSLPLPTVLQAIEDFAGVPRRLEAVEAQVERENKRVRAALGLDAEAPL